MPPIRRASLLAALAALGAACATGGTSAPPSGEAPSTSAAPAADPDDATADATEGDLGAPSPRDGAQGDAGPLAFTAPTLDGGTLEGAAYAGQDVILWMWAPW